MIRNRAGWLMLHLAHASRSRLRSTAVPVPLPTRQPAARTGCGSVSFRAPYAVALPGPKNDVFRAVMLDAWVFFTVTLSWASKLITVSAPCWLMWLARSA